MYKPIEVKPLSGYKIWLKYSDGTSGEVDLSHLAGKGVFKYWDNYDNFRRVTIGENGEIAWSEEIDLCPDSLYLKIAGKTAEELFTGLCMEYDHA